MSRSWQLKFRCTSYIFRTFEVNSTMGYNRSTIYAADPRRICRSDCHILQPCVLWLLSCSTAHQNAPHIDQCLCRFKETHYIGMCSVLWAAWMKANTVLFKLSSLEPWGSMKACPRNAGGNFGILYAVWIIFTTYFYNNIKPWLLGNIKQVYCIFKWNSLERTSCVT